MAEIPINNWKLLYEAGRQALQNRKLQDAEQSFSAALQLAEDFAAGDPRLAATLNALARIYSLQRRYLAAAALLNRLLEVTERTLGPTHVQVAGVLTNLAEMYTHLGAAREELELRERVLRIRGEAPDADIASLQRVWDRVAELRAILIAQEITADRDNEAAQEPLPIVQTAEYSSPIPMVHEPEPEPEIAPEPVLARAAVAPQAKPRAAQVAETRSFDREPKSMVVASAGVEIISLAPGLPTTRNVDHGFSDMGRDELLDEVTPRKGRSSLLSIAAGVVLVAGLIAARDYVTTSEERGVSTGSVSLAASSTSQSSGVAQVSQDSENVSAPEPNSGTVQRVISGRRLESEATRAKEDPGAPDNFGPYRAASAEPKIPTAADLERALRSVDGAVKSIATRTKAEADSALALRVQAPTFKKIRIADNPTPER
jgi:tetratricopeptide (TPR) repeat protein